MLRFTGSYLSSGFPYTPPVLVISSFLIRFRVELARVVWSAPPALLPAARSAAMSSLFRNFFAPHKSSPPPRPIQRPRAPRAPGRSRAPALPPHSGWLSGPVVLRLQEGADRVALKPVAEAARKLKLATTAGDDWTVLWSYKSPWELIDSLAKRRATAGARPYLVNHLPGTIRLVSKVHLVRFSAELAARLPRTFGAITPETYALPEQARLLDAAIARRGLSDAYGWPNWLAKSKQHRGIHVLSGNANQTVSSLGEALVQERVRPLLLPGLPRVFDVGLYVLVSSVRPLRAWAFNRSLVRVCLSSYPRERRTKGWARAAFAESRRYVIKEYTPLWRLRAFAPHLRRCAGEAGCAMRAALDEAGYDGGGVWRRMERIAATLLVALRPGVEAALARRRMRGASAFELLRFDFLVDEDAQARLRARVRVRLRVEP